MSMKEIVEDLKVAVEARTKVLLQERLSAIDDEIGGMLSQHIESVALSCSIAIARSVSKR